MARNPEGSLLRLVTIDLSDADLEIFERYESEVLSLVPKYGGRLEMRVRTVDGRKETHLLYFPDEAAFEGYRSDPARLALSSLWEQSRARSVAELVRTITDI
jgi:uncharacterized protein (DUF1330 family)